MKRIFLLSSVTALLLGANLSQSVHAAIALDRTRVIFDASNQSETLGISNQNKNLPYLAQAWIEDAQGNKITTPITALPPIQRVEPGSKGQIKLQMTGDGSLLAQNKETLFYFNVREIPPKSNKPNTLQIALQTRIKMFYRPTSLTKDSSQAIESTKQLTLTKEGTIYKVNNPTGFFVTIVNVSSDKKNASISGFKPEMIAPQSSLQLKGNALELGRQPVVTIINDYGGRPKLVFKCVENSCSVEHIIDG